VKITSIKDCLYVIAFRNKYDILPNEATKEIINAIKNNKGELHIEKDNIPIHIHIEKLDKKTGEFNEYSFKIEAHSQANENLDEPEIILIISLNKDFSPKKYEQINYVIYENLRHEFEHINNFILEKKPDDTYKDIYKKLLGYEGVAKNEEELLQNIKLVSEYILSETEILSYVKSILYVAKKQKRDVKDVIRQIFNRAFYNNKRENMLLAQRIPEVQEIINKTEKGLSNKIKQLYPRFQSIFR